MRDYKYSNQHQGIILSKNCQTIVNYIDIAHMQVRTKITNRSNIANMMQILSNKLFESLKNINTSRVQHFSTRLKVVGFVYASETSIFRLAEGLHSISQTNTVRIQLRKLLVCYCTHLPSQHTNKIRTRNVFVLFVLGWHPRTLVEHLKIAYIQPFYCLKILHFYT